MNNYDLRDSYTTRSTYEIQNELYDRVKRYSEIRSRPYADYSED